MAARADLAGAACPGLGVRGREVLSERGWGGAVEERAAEMLSGPRLFFDPRD